MWPKQQQVNRDLGRGVTLHRQDRKTGQVSKADLTVGQVWGVLTTTPNYDFYVRYGLHQLQLQRAENGVRLLNKAAKVDILATTEEELYDNLFNPPSLVPYDHYMDQE